jgi:hypothetical protein
MADLADRWRVRMLTRVLAQELQDLTLPGVEFVRHVFGLPPTELVAGL